MHHSFVPGPCSVLLAVALLAGCQTSPPPDYGTLAAQADAGEAVAAGALRAAFLASPDYDERMERLSGLELEALQVLEDEPLKLASRGSAILETYYGSLAGHAAMARFYNHVDAKESATRHEQWIEALRTEISAGRDGSETAPYPVISTTEAQAFLITGGERPVGSLYRVTETRPFTLVMSARKPDEPLATYMFDLSGAFEALRREVSAEAQEDFSPEVLISALAERNDSAAQATIGAYLAAHDRPRDAISWLRLSARSGNVLANMMLAQLYGTRAGDSEGEERDEALGLMLDNYLHAVALGSDDAMYVLGNLYINDQFGPDNASSGVALLDQAADFGNVNAMLLLAHMNAQGVKVAADETRAQGYFVRAAETGNARARVDYARFLLARHPEVAFDSRAYDWLKAVAAADKEPEAMLLLGNIYAKGVHVDKSVRRAINWFKSAVAASPDDAYIVNEVAWTLAVTHDTDLRTPRYALEIMERVMGKDTDARSNPAYLDTWAATYAANGNFERAVTVQQDAVQEAEKQSQADVIEVLKQHLEAFLAGEAITDPVP